MFYLVIDTCGVSQTFADSHYLPSSVLSTRGSLSSQTDEKPSFKLGFYVLLKIKASQHKPCNPGEWVTVVGGRSVHCSTLNSILEF